MSSTITDRRNGLTTSVAVKAPCAAVASSNITLAGLQTIGAVTVESGDRVLVIGQTDQTENGIYVADTGDWSRSLDFDGLLDAVQGTLVLVRNQFVEGAFYELTTSNPVNFGSSSIQFRLRDAPNVTFDLTQNEIDAGVTPIDYSYPPGNALRYGAVGDGSANDTTALSTWWNLGKQGVELFLPSGTYKSISGLSHTSKMVVRGEPGARIKITAASDYVIRLDFTGGSGFGYGSDISDLILDGGGFAVDGLSLKGVISATFDDIRATNVIVAGLHLHWSQLCNFKNYICSGNVEAFTTTPVNGILADTASCSANTFINATIEHVSGDGIKAERLVNSLFLNGTSEGNGGWGIAFGHASTGTSLGNVVVCMDLEVNTSGDVVMRATAGFNTFLGVASGFSSPVVQCIGSSSNFFYGGVTSGFTFDSSSNNNQVIGTRILGSGRTITDSGTGNNWSGVYNVTDGLAVADKEVRRRGNFSLSNGQTANINSATTSYAVITASGATLTIAAPTNPVDAMDLDITIHNTSGGAITTTWDAAFKKPAWTDPATGFNRSARYRYDVNYGFWYLIAQGAADVAN